MEIKSDNKGHKQKKRAQKRHGLHGVRGSLKSLNRVNPCNPCLLSITCYLFRRTRNVYLLRLLSDTNHSSDGWQNVRAC